MRNLLIAIGLILTQGSTANAQSQPRWLIQPALSPDGKWIAFGYKGNLFKAPSTGGPATPLTINNFYNGYPVWSHDGKKIAFASDRYGNFDIFIVNSTGGEATRLTANSAKDIPCDFSTDDQQVLFGTDRHDIYTSARFPGDNYWMKLFSVPVKGGASSMINSAGTEFLHYNEKGDKFIFQDRKGYEDPWRKHHTSPVTRDIWVYDTKTHEYTKVSDFKGEDREPVWGKGDEFYYLSERNGNQNLYKGSLANPASPQQLTSFEKNPVRNLSRSNDGLLAFTYNGDLYTLNEGSQPQKITITLDADFSGDETTIIPVKGEASEMAISADGKQVAFVYRGDIFVTSADGATTRRITNTPYQERMVEFSPDGRSLLYSAEHEASWDIEQTTIASKTEPYFYAATLLTTTPVVASGKDEFQGVYSPDGKKIAYLEERNILKTVDLATKATNTLIPEGVNYSYSDGDQYFAWSPDSKWLLAQSGESGGWQSREVVLLKDDGSGKRTNLTGSGFDDLHPQWGIDGKMMYWLSNKQGMKNLSRGGQSDVYAMFFDPKAWDRFQLSKEDFDLKTELEKKDTTKKPTTPLELDLRNLDDRTQRLTSTSSILSGAKLSKDGEKLYYLAAYEKGFDLWQATLRTHETKQLAKLDATGGRIEMTRDGKFLFVLAGGSIYKVNTEDGKVSPVKINTEMELNASAERTYIFDHAWKQVKKKLFDPKLQGVDWDYYHNNYRQFLPHINNNYDFQLLLSEFLGELNASHTGGRYAPDFPNGDETAALGLFYDLERKQDGLLVKEIIAGGPFDKDGTHMTPGVIIDKIDGNPVTMSADWSALLNHKAGQLTLISFHDPKTNAAYEESVKPIKPRIETATLLYNRWTHRMERLVDSLSGGRLGYVHVRSMDDPSFRITFDKVLGKNIDKEALIVDTRYNGGGWLHDDLVTFLGGKLYFTLHPQNHTTKGGESLNKWTKPSCVVMSEGNYSDAFMFPYAYKHLGIGKLVGMPVAGTGTAVWWETQINPRIVFGIPMVASYGSGEDHPTENHQLDPDIRVSDDYNKILSGEDQQIEAAVQLLIHR
ncbi:MAG TPA: S41 family peptidase [Puia sp.]|uniref:S41 family peptidase n=1 Tax=Puia sp. TaxID=2045100 RepID=UPI002D0D64D1|nr:S41 family peptidase [Puia sp.]HVU95226.1 S41 family peptidase [Puia sp.]